jgi:hypothetical protein
MIRASSVIKSKNVGNEVLYIRDDIDENIDVPGRQPFVVESKRQNICPGTPQKASDKKLCCPHLDDLWHTTWIE